MLTIQMLANSANILTLNTKDEFEKRKKLALLAIRRKLDTDEDDSEVHLFVSHHLEEVAGEYWQEVLGTEQPTSEQVLGIITYRENCNYDDEFDLETFDFTLPDDVTDYVICVSFNVAGEICDIEMES